MSKNKRFMPLTTHSTSISSSKKSHDMPVRHPNGTILKKFSVAMSTIVSSLAIFLGHVRL
jgi:hypothetical protein